uniref:hypothetical protein n=1 Tax=Arthrobacter sp. TaxID=1667 RepID=UPI001599FABD|nr:hypothetical protein [Arthrobacter sp.]QJS06532.1 hypothetical protein [Arthrobacter sp.]
MNLLKNKNVKTLKTVLKILEKETLEIFLGIIAVIIFIFYYKKVSFMSLIDFTIIVPFLILYFSKILSDFFSRILINKIEDYIKLERDYNALVNRYPLEKKFVEYDNRFSEVKSLIRNKVETKFHEKKDNYIFPIVIEVEMKNKKINVKDDKNKEYILPEIIKNSYEHLMNAHSTSALYNQINIRLDKIEEKNDLINLHTSRTMYYDSLVTNRVMDFKLFNNISIRDMLDPGPYINTIEKSLLSNHIGFNIYIKTKDNKLIFIKRNMNVSIGKGTLGSSVAASLKTRYCLDENLNFSIEGIKRAVLEEMNDELGIQLEGKEKETFSIEKNLKMIYRDIIEGGKPQFLFYLELNKDQEEVTDLFRKNLMKKDKKYETIVDGDEIVFLDLNNKKDLYLSPDTIIFGKDRYPVLPSVSGTLAYLLNSLEKTTNSDNSSE